MFVRMAHSNPPARNTAIGIDLEGRKLGQPFWFLGRIRGNRSAPRFAGVRNHTAERIDMTLGA